MLPIALWVMFDRIGAESGPSRAERRDEPAPRHSIAQRSIDLLVVSAARGMILSGSGQMGSTGEPDA
jgi:hypothetical protein